MTGKNLSESDTDFTKLPRKLSKAFSLQKVKITGIKTIAGDDCNPDIVPTPVPPQPRPAKSLVPVLVSGLVSGLVSDETKVTYCSRCGHQDKIFNSTLYVERKSLVTNPH